MSDYITLLGAEEVQRAASSMRQSAEIMQSADGNIEDSLMRHRQFMDDWLARLEQTFTDLAKDL